MESTQSLMMMKMRITMTLRSTIINNTKQQALTEGSEQVAEQTCLSSLWQSPCNRRGHWDWERRWVGICLADPKSAFLWSATTRHSSSKIPSQFQTGSQDTLIPETPFMSLNFFLLPSQSQNPGQRSSISSIFALSAQHLQIYPSSQSTKTVSSKTAQRGKAMAATPGALSSRLGAHMRKKRANRTLQIGLSFSHMRCAWFRHMHRKRGSK